MNVVLYYKIEEAELDLVLVCSEKWNKYLQQILKIYVVYEGYVNLFDIILAVSK